MDNFGALFDFKLLKHISISFNKDNISEFLFLDKKSSPTLVKSSYSNGIVIDYLISRVHSSNFLIISNSK